MLFGEAGWEVGSPAMPWTAGLGRAAGSELLPAELSFPLSANHICIVRFLCVCVGGVLFMFFSVS